MSAPRFTRLLLKNWKNFTSVDSALASRVFLVGPNASGKSNFLDAFRFLHDLAIEGGGLAKAVELRGGLSKVRSLYARGLSTEIRIGVTIQSSMGGEWKYELAFTHLSQKNPVPMITQEKVEKISTDGKIETLLDRPQHGSEDEKDKERMTQTAVQQVNLNQHFREMVVFFRDVSYLHLVPQLLREEQPAKADKLGSDPYGRDLLDRIRLTSPKTRRGRLTRIQKILAVLSSQLETLDLVIDDHGRPHLQGKFKHWRPQGAYQNETQFSDGTLRLIGLLWSLQEKGGPLLLEEPELSLHPAIVKRLAAFIYRAQKAGHGRQVLLSTHSDDLLVDEGIAPEEVLMVEPAAEGSRIIVGAEREDIVNLMKAGIPASEAILPKTETPRMESFDRLSL